MIEFNNVFFGYPNSDKDVLKNISLKIKKGSWTTVLGNNGSGKSTLMKLICGQYIQKSGSIYLENEEYSEKILNKIRDKIAIVFQNPDNQFVGSTVEEDIAFGLENKGISWEEMDKTITDVLNIVDMNDYRKKEPRQLSGGQKQRVAIAANLALNPKVLILDEATSMLDPVSRKKILSYIKKIHEEQNLTILAITHDMEELIYSDEVIIFNNGELVYKGEYEDLVKDVNILSRYSLEVPFREKIKKELNDFIENSYFNINDDEKGVIEKLCKLVLKK